MERLTKRIENSVVYSEFNSNNSDGCYEMMDNCLHKLADYEDAEEQGLLLRLPCKVGDRTYQVVTKYEKINKGGCTCCTTACGSNCNCDYFTEDEECMNFTAKDNYQIISRGFKLEDFENFDKTIFLTKEEAEQTLAKMKKNDL